MVKRVWSGIAILTHPAILEASWLSYWSQGHIGWVVATWGLLVGVGAFLYAWLRAAPREAQTLLGSPRRFLLLWNLLAIGGMWAATADLLLHFWLTFLLWMAFLGFALHWWREYSFHVYGWSAMAGFFAAYGRSYPAVALCFAILTGAVAWLRYHQRAHTLAEILWGAGVGCIGAWAFIGIQALVS